MAEIKPIQWLNGRVRIIDQTRLPLELAYREIADYREMAEAIRSLRVRGAPLLGVAAAYGVVLGALGIKSRQKEDFLARLSPVFDTLAQTRPTAVNLFGAIQRMRAVLDKGSTVAQVKQALLREAQLVQRETEKADCQLGTFGAELVPPGATVLTHCNTGALATGGYGTALGVVRTAWAQGKRIKVMATETRPLLQGARLTAWELLQKGIPVTLITDSMAGHFMKQGRIDLVIVGADRIAANGDTANKIGTYTLAVLAMENARPFYVAAPTTTIDFNVASGEAIPIEERKPEEVTHIQGVPIAPPGVVAANPAFDVTPHRYITAIITEKGIAREPYQDRLRKLAGS